MKRLTFILFPALFLLTLGCKKCPECPESDPTTSKTDTVHITEYADTGDYKVPILSASIDNMYYQCGNTIILDLPKGWTNPSIKVSQADIFPSKLDKRKFTITPSGKTCVLSCTAIKADGNRYSWERKYNVIKPPKPDIILLVNGKEYNGASPISKKSNCVVKLKPNSDFLAAFPKDARYMISSVDLLSQRSLGAPSKVGSYAGFGKDAIKGIPIPLGNKLKSDVPGTKIYFKIDNIYRVNFQNKKIEENFSDRMLYIGALIK